MEHGPAVECAVDIDASCEYVFDVIHNYDIRLHWDRMLSSASIVDGSCEAGPGVRTLCIGRDGLARLGMETVYITFDRPRVAAVRMTRGPWFISDFAASIRHIAAAGTENRSRVIYKFRVTARPGWIRAVADPVLRFLFQRETRKRLESLKRYLENNPATSLERTPQRDRSV
jgi:hypothetical protein